jgi:NAD-dependent deacetylase
VPDRGRAGARPVVINRDPTPYDDLTAEVVRADITHAVHDLVEQLFAAGAAMRGADDARRRMPA